MGSITGFFHGGITVSDMERSLRFYEEGLRLYAECAKRLDAADLRVTQLSDALAKQAGHHSTGRG